jgi:CheY-like chemotaxis protein
LALAPGPYVRIGVEDHGHGIPRESLGRVFDPFFSTKPGGSGLGLTSSYWIVQRHGGTITVDSVLGTGSQFAVYLPRSSVAPDAAEGPAHELAPGCGRVLFMDDDEPIRDFVAILLAQLGYDVESTADGAEAIERFERARAAGRPFDVVVLDLTVPAGLGGKETLARLLAIDPQVRAIVCSGYSNDPILADHRAYGFAAALAKPYVSQALSRVLRDVLTGRPDS